MGFHYFYRARKEEHNYYYMTVDNNRMIDAGPKVRQALILVVADTNIDVFL